MKSNNIKMFQLVLPNNLPKECSMFYNDLARCFELAAEANKNGPLTSDDWLNIIATMINQKYDVPPCYIKAYYETIKTVQKGKDQNFEIVELFNMIQFAENFGILTFNTDDTRTIFDDMKPVFDDLVKTIQKIKFYLVKNILPEFIKGVNDDGEISILLKDIRSIVKQIYLFAFESEIQSEIEPIFIENIYSYFKNKTYIKEASVLYKTEDGDILSLYYSVISTYISLLLARWIVFTNFMKQKNG